MAVRIKVLTHSDEDNSSEYEAAEELKAMLEDSFAKYPNANGNVYIGYSLTLSGQKVRDIDLLLYGEVENCVLKSFYQSSTDERKKDVGLESFCYVIELKDHDASKVKTANTHLMVNYRGDWKDVSDQSEAQKYSFMNYFYRANGYKPFVCNIIWFRQVSNESLQQIMIGTNSINALPVEFGVDDLVRQNIAQLNEEKFKPYQGMYHINVNADGAFCEDMRLLFQERQVASGLTRKKLECIMQKSIGDVDKNDKLTIFSGRAGTGKTFFLIQNALRLANSKEGYRCLILTYNTALVADIRRLLHFIDIPDNVDSYTVQITPLHDFFVGLMKVLTGEFPETYNDYLKRYRECLKNLYKYVNESIDSADIKYLKELGEIDIDWDYVFVDEAQDWSDIEKKILFKIYGPKHIIVADGIDQFIRTGQRQHWERDVQVNTISNSMGMRQKSNLTTFVNAFAKECGIKWDVKINKKILGGKVRIISTYDKEEHAAIVENCKTNGCDNYDILFLVPPKDVKTNEDGERGFLIKEKFRNMGINIFDGTNPKQREQYATSASECRLYQYDSCRGLEGWCTICLSFDELIKYKGNIYKDNPSASLSLESPEDRKRKFVYLWSLMPLTRPIDTLVITLDKPNSEVGLILNRIANKYPDFVEWAIK